MVMMFISSLLSAHSSLVVVSLLFRLSFIHSATIHIYCTVSPFFVELINLICFFFFFFQVTQWMYTFSYMRARTHSYINMVGFQMVRVLPVILCIYRLLSSSWFWISFYLGASLVIKDVICICIFCIISILFSLSRF